ncbi:MAG: cardiolipin synthase ClsB [Casimicrobium sp.]|jgi:cardiolipin synthase
MKSAANQPSASAKDVRLLCSGAEYFPALLAAIQTAVAEISLETYIFADDVTGQQVARALIEAARRGVSVRVVYDGFGSSSWIGGIDKQLREGGVQVAVYRPERGWQLLRRSRLRRMHRKITVIDGRIAFIGGINVIDDLNMPEPRSPRFDFAVSLRGPLVDVIESVAHKLWRRLRHFRLSDELDAAFPDDPPTVPAPVADARSAWFAVRDNVSHRRDIEQEYLIAIGKAESEILLANAYFVPGRRFRRALIDAAERGVKIRLLLQGRQEYWLQHFATRALYGALLAAGVEIYDYERSFLHAKVAVVDGRWATVGSSNIDPFSLLLAREANVFVDDTAFASELKARLEAAITADSRPVSPAYWEQRSWWNRTLTWVAYGMARGMLGMMGYGRH